MSSPSDHVRQGCAICKSPVVNSIKLLFLLFYGLLQMDGQERCLGMHTFAAFSLQHHYCMAAFQLCPGLYDYKAIKRPITLEGWE